MPRVPTITDRQQLDVVESPRLNASAFGGNQAQQVENITGQAAKILYVRQQQIDSAKATENLTQYKLEKDARFQKEVYALKGLDAAEQAAVKAATIDKELREKYGEGLSKSQRGIFDAGVGEFSIRESSLLRKYVADETDTARVNTLNAQNSLFADEAVKSPDKTGIDKNLSFIYNNNAALYKGQSEEVISAANLKAKSEIYKGKLEALGSDKRKLDFLQSNYESFEPSFASGRLTQLQKGALEENAAEVAANKVREVLSGADAQKVEESITGQDAEIVKASYQKQLGVALAEKKKSEDNTTDAAITSVYQAQTGGVQALVRFKPDSRLPQAVQDAQMSLVNQMIKEQAEPSKAVQTDPMFYVELKAMSKDDLASQDPKQWVGKLGLTEYKELVKDWNEARNGTDNPERVTQWGSLKTVVEDVTGKKVNSKNPMESSDTRSLLGYSITRINAEERKLGRKLTPDEIQKEVYASQINIKREGRDWWAQPLYKMGERADISVEGATKVGDIPAPLKTSIENKLDRHFTGKWNDKDVKKIALSMARGDTSSVLDTARKQLTEDGIPVTESTLERRYIDLLLDL